MNPLSSPWNQPKKVFITDQQLYWRWHPVQRYLTCQPQVSEYRGMLAIDRKFYLAKKSSKMRLLSHLDWCWYTPKTLAQAINNDTVEEYYEVMLRDVRSDPNEWKDKNLEQELKSFYAARVGRASLL